MTALHGYVQAEYLKRDISVDELSAGTGAPLNEDKFAVRRARLSGRSDWCWAGVSGEVELFGAGAVARPIAAEVHAQYSTDRAKPAIVGLRGGLIPVPFGFENYEQSHVQRFFGEQALFTNSLVPGRYDFGVGLFGQVWSLNWALAAQNGQPIGAPDFAYQDPNRAKDLAARIQVRREVVKSFDARFAVSLLEGRGFSPGTQPTKTTFEWRDLNEDGRVAVSELVPIPGSAGRASTSFRRWAVGADLQLRAKVPVIGDLLVYGEAALGVNVDRAIAPADPILLGRDQRGLGWYAAVVQNVTQYFSLGARYEEYDPNIDALDQFGGNAVIARRKFKTLSAGVSANFAAQHDMRGRVLLEYERQKNSLGRDARGLPAQLANDTLRARLEVAF